MNEKESMIVDRFMTVVILALAFCLADKIFCLLTGFWLWRLILVIILGVLYAGFTSWMTASGINTSPGGIAAIYNDLWPFSQRTPSATISFIFTLLCLGIILIVQFYLMPYWWVYWLTIVIVTMVGLPAASLMNEPWD